VTVIEVPSALTLIVGRLLIVVPLTSPLKATNGASSACRSRSQGSCRGPSAS
jgi:hypothetical protein